MNAKLEELMYESGLTAQGSFEDMDKYDQEAILKFADLLVKECIDAIENAEALRLRKEHFVDVIKKRFGMQNEV